MTPRLRRGFQRNQTAEVRIVIVEDHLMFREVLRKVCTEDLQHEVVGEADDGKRAIEVVRRATPDLVLLDLHLPNLDGFGVVDAIRKIAPYVRILVLSSHCDEYTVFMAEKLRVQGFVDKNTNTVATLKVAITTVSEGKMWFSPAFQRTKLARRSDPNSFDKILTDRERDMLALFGTPFSDEQIGAKLAISIETVQKHRFNLLRKLELNSAPELVRYAREHGFTLPTSVGGEPGLLP